MSNQKNKIKDILVVILFVTIIIITIGCNRIKDGDQAAHDEVSVSVSKFNKFADASDEDFNYRIAFDKGYSSSDDEMTKEYLALQQKYRNELSKFLTKKLNIGNLNDEMKTINLLGSKKKSLKDVASTEEYFLSISNIDSCYLYLRNNVKIERVSKKDMQLLNGHSTMNEKMKMVERTYKKVLAVDYSSVEEDEYSISYNGTGSEIVNNDAIVFYLTYQVKLDQNGKFINDDETTDEFKTAKDVAKKYSKLYSDQLGSTVKIFVHRTI